MRGSRRLAAVLTLVGLAVTACGTTVPISQQRQGQSGTTGLADGLTDGGASSGTTGTVPSGASTGSTGTTGGSPSGSTGGSSTTTTATSGGTTGNAGATTGGPAPVSSVPARGGTIKIGALTASGAGKYQQSLGFSGATGDQTAMTKSVVSWINAHGGYGGRKIQLVTYDLDPAAVTANQSAAMQAACTYFTQDNKVSAVASYVALAPDNFYACLARAHVPLVTPDEGVSSRFFRRYPSTVYMPSSPSYTRLLADSVDALWDAGWLTKTSTVGVVGYDTTDVHAIVDDGLAPALQRHGLKVATGLYTSTTTSSAGEYNGGVLSFKTKHVDRVFFAPGGQPIYFALAAQQQGYHPYYELGSLEYPSVLAANLPAGQLVGSMGLGWLPYFDLPSSAWSSVSPPGMPECRRAIASAHQDLSSGTTLGIAAWICDDWMFLRDAFAAGASPDEAGIRRAADSLGSTFKPAATFGSTLSPTRTHDGASAYRLVAFQQSCSCFQYRSTTRPLA